MSFYMGPLKGWEIFLGGRYMISTTVKKTRMIETLILPGTELSNICYRKEEHETMDIRDI